MSKYTFDQAWEVLREYEVATYDELLLVTAVSGRALETLAAVLYERTGYNNFDDLEEGA